MLVTRIEFQTIADWRLFRFGHKRRRRTLGAIGLFSAAAIAVVFGAWAFRARPRSDVDRDGRFAAFDLDNVAKTRTGGRPVQGIIQQGRRGLHGCGELTNDLSDPCAR